jgi:hypothetical protein
LICFVLPCLAVALLRCLALPCLALPCLALPCLALPCRCSLALPCLALPCLALPYLALPCRCSLALPCLTLPLLSLSLSPYPLTPTFTSASERPIKCSLTPSCAQLMTPGAKMLSMQHLKWMQVQHSTAQHSAPPFLSLCKIVSYLPSVL